MAIADEMDDAFAELQAVLNYSATIGGVCVPVTKGPAVQLSEEYGPGGINETQAVSLFYAMACAPVPAIGQHITFRELTYRIEVIKQHTVTWEIEAVQVFA